MTRFKTPWLVGDCIWTQKLKSKAIVWLSKEDQAILKLTADYNNNGMSDLLAQEGSAYDLILICSMFCSAP
jgi:glucosamine-6-phosphate deaminase